MACHPLDTVKTRLQVSGGNEGMLSVLRTLAARDGVLSLWRGAAAPTLTVASSTSLVFTINSMIRQALLANFPALARPNPHVARDASQPPTVLAHSGFFVAGFIGGAISSFITGPAELAKTKVQAQGMAVKGQHAEAAAVRYRGSLHCMYEVGKRYGLAGLFQGQLSCTARNALGQCAYFGMYAKVSDALKPADSISVPLHIAFASGGIAGALPRNAAPRAAAPRHAPRPAQASRTGLLATLWTSSSPASRLSRPTLPTADSAPCAKRTGTSWRTKALAASTAGLGPASRGGWFATVSSSQCTSL